MAAMKPRGGAGLKFGWAEPRRQIAFTTLACKHPRLVRTRRPAAWVLLGVMGLGCWPAWAETPAPSGVQSLDEIPSAKREDVSRLLRKVGRRYGPDAVVIQTHLLLNAMQKGSVLATGVRVERIEHAHGKRYLGFALETGLVFDDHTRDESARLRFLWASILEPTLARLTDGLQVEADGILVRMQYYHRPYKTIAELRASIEQPGTSEEAAFAVLASDVDATVRGELPLREVLARTHVTVDGAERKVAAPATDQVLTPGPE
jgi:hypothetical protein